MSNENADHPIASEAVDSLRRDLHRLGARHAAEFDAMCQAGDPHVPNIHSINIDTRCKLVGLLPPAASDVSGDHASANVVIYIPDNGRDASQPIG